MHQENLKFLYSEYKNCMKNEFFNYFGKDDEYKSYLDKCYNQKQDITTYFNKHFRKTFNIDPAREQREVFNKYERRFDKFAAYGWTGNQVKNYFLNYDRSQEEYDVWVNRIMARESQEKYGLKEDVDELELEEERLPVLFGLLISRNVTPPFYSFYKWTGDPKEKWRKYAHRGYARDIKPMS